MSDSPPRREKRRGRLAIMVAVGLAVLVGDQVTKSMAVHDLSHHSVHLIGPFSLSLSYNTGIAFSIGTGLTLPIVIVATALIVAVVWFARGLPSTIAAVAIGLIEGGALGNLSDRLFRGHHGGVVDFLASTFWPTFNLADASIVCGCVLLVLGILRSGPEQGRKRRSRDSPVASASPE